MEFNIPSGLRNFKFIPSVGYSIYTDHEHEDISSGRYDTPYFTLEDSLEMSNDDHVWKVMAF